MKKLKWWNGRGWNSIRVDHEDRKNFPDRCETAYVCSPTKKQALQMLSLITPFVTPYEFNNYWNQAKGNIMEKIVPKNQDQEGVWVSRDERWDGQDIDRILGRCPSCDDFVIFGTGFDTDWYGSLQYGDCKNCGEKLVCEDSLNIDIAAP